MGHIGGHGALFLIPHAQHHVIDRSALKRSGERFSFNCAFHHSEKVIIFHQMVANQISKLLILYRNHILSILKINLTRHWACCRTLEGFERVQIRLQLMCSSSDCVRKKIQ